MREHLYRGKRKRDGVWIYGFYYTTEGKHFILGNENPDSDIQLAYEVIPETAGQYTGLLDRNGVKIFEGDILKIFHFIDGRRKKHFLYHVVQWSEKYTGWIAANNGQKDADPKNGSPQLWCYVKNEFEIAGNIHDNHDLVD